MIKIKAFFYFFIGILLVGFLIWNRLIRSRDIVDFVNTKPIYFLSLIINVLIISFLMYQIFCILNIKLKIKFSSISLFAKFTQKLNSVINDIFKITFNYIFYNIPKVFSLGDKLYKLGSYLYDNIYLNKLWLNLIVISFSVLPKVIVSLLFFYDVFIHQQLNLFFKSLILLIIPLFFSVFLYTLKDFSYTNRKIIQTQHLDITKMANGNAVIKAKVEFKSQAQFKEYADMWNKFGSILIFSGATQDLVIKYSLYVNLFCYLIYLIGWLYILALQLQII
jgi:hypothetical protein